MTDVVTYDVVPRAGVIDLGKQVEGLVTRVVLPNIRRGKGAVQLVHQRADDQKPYLVPITEDGDKVYWIVTRSDTAFPGRGQAELQWLGEMVLWQNPLPIRPIPPDLWRNPEPSQTNR